MRSSARLITLVRLLLLVVALAVLGVLRGVSDPGQLIWAGWMGGLQALLTAVAIFTGITAASVKFIKRPVWLMVQLQLDLLWLGLLIFLTGGVGSPVVSLLFAVVLISNLALPTGGIPFLIPSVGAALLGGSALLYLFQILPVDMQTIEEENTLFFGPRILSNLAVQVGALYMVDFMGQVLARRLSEQRLLTGELLDHLGEGVVATDRDGIVVYGNQTAADLLGVAGIAVGTPMSDYLQAEFLAPVREALSEYDLPISVRVTTPGKHHLLLRMNRLVGRRGRMIGTTYLVTDETKLRRLEGDSIRRERLASLGEMAAGIAHEVRNPLTSLRGCAQEMAGMARAGSHGDTNALIHIILHEADRLAQLVEDFLGMARMRNPDYHPVRLLDEFEDLEHLTRLREDIPSRLVLSFACDPKLPPIQADTGQLRQVMTNLINNSIDAIRRLEDPCITVEAELVDGKDLDAAADHAVLITIHDNGVGIPPEKMKQIFTPFYSTKSQGTGLGMTVVSRIVDQHGAQMAIDSEPGKGTTIRLLWPLFIDSGAFSVQVG